MLLAIDAGNTNTVFGLRGKTNDMQFVSWRMATNAETTADDYAAWLAFHLAQAEYKFADITGVIVSSVVPQILAPLTQFISQHIPAPLYTLTASNTSHGVAIAIDKPDQAGSDRLANTAAMQLYRLPAIVIDFGTATTFDYIDKAGAYAGGVIAPGVNLSIAALYEAAAQLPMLDPDEWQPTMPIIGTTTRSAMHSGVFYGYISLIEGILHRMQTAIHPTKHASGEADLAVIATGGLGAKFASATASIDAYDKDLTLKGLAVIYDRQDQTAMTTP